VIFKDWRTLPDLLDQYPLVPDLSGNSARIVKHEYVRATSERVKNLLVLLGSSLLGWHWPGMGVLV
jgi:hypothetical protein